LKFVAYQYKLFSQPGIIHDYHRQPSSLTVAAPTGGTAISFQTLAQGFRLASTQSQPALWVVTNASSRDKLTPLISVEQQPLLKGVDLEKWVVLAVFWGAKPSGGFSITIDKVSITRTDLVVNVILREHNPDAAPVDASTFPYHLVIIDRHSLPEGAKFHFRLIDYNTLLAEGDLP
jgi:hypothetical protein